MTGKSPKINQGEDWPPNDTGLTVENAQDILARKNKPSVHLCCWRCWREKLPYGAWFTKDKSEVYFNRSYSPIWRLDFNGTAEKVGYHWVKDIVSEEFYFNDTNSPLRGARTKQQRASFWLCVAALGAFDIDVRCDDPTNWIQDGWPDRAELWKAAWGPRDNHGRQRMPDPESCHD